MRYLYNPPLVIKKIFRNCRWESSNNKILFTFDDGPIPEATQYILSELQKHKIKALFFCVGGNVKRNSSLVKELIDEGHTIGNHTFHHKNLRKIDNKEIDSEIISFNNLMNEEFSYEVNYFRPPYGKISFGMNDIIIKNNMTAVMWSLLTYDYKNDLNLVKFAVSKYLRKNSIIVLHDSLKSKNIIIDSIKYIVDEAEKKDFKIGTPEECLK